MSAVELVEAKAAGMGRATGRGIVMEEVFGHGYVVSVITCKIPSLLAVS